MNKTDVAIIGGGLAGLAMAIQLARGGFSVIVFEKEKYPQHKVCGEYISMESWNFLTSLGLPLLDMELPLITQLEITSPSGKALRHSLTPGGFGISRYRLDNELQKLARANGVVLLEATKVQEVIPAGDNFLVKSSADDVEVKLVIGAFGKRSNLDIRLNREFVKEKPNKLNNYLGIKYHIEFPQAANLISLHNFENGYCGISKIDGEKYCLCYLTTAYNLKRYNNSIPDMEKHILHKNPFLKKIFKEANFLWNSPLTISQVSFAEKSQVQDHILMIGDAGGMISPLCGNGMSMALHASKIACECIIPFLKNIITRKEMEVQYIKRWQNEFSSRLAFGRTIQRFFGKSWLTNILISSLKPFPFITRILIDKSHGKSF